MYARLLQVYLTDAERVVLVSCFDTRPPQVRPLHPARKFTDCTQVFPVQSPGAIRCQAKGPTASGMGFTVGRFSGSVLVVITSLLGVHMAVCVSRRRGPLAFFSQSTMPLPAP